MINPLQVFFPFKAIFPGLAPYIPLLRRETLEEKEEVLNKFQNAMKYFELELESRGTTFFGGEEHPKMLDYMIWPWLERADIVPLINRSLELLPKTNFPLMVTIFYTSTSLVVEHLFRVCIHSKYVKLSNVYK